MLKAKYSNYVMRHIKRPFRVIVSIITLGSFLFSHILSDLAWAAPQSLKGLNVKTFALPEYLGTIKYNWVSDDQRKTIIHIQDAHCNYAAQHKISEILKYLNKNYGIRSVNLEGGAKDYDLSIFAGIKNTSIRDKVCDYFVKEGLVNGAEYFAINNPGKVKLWGMEDAKLYLKNLNAYRVLLKHKDEISRYLKNLTLILNELKTHIYSKELLAFDLEYSEYKAGKVEFKDYLNYLSGLCKEKAIDIKEFSNVRALNEVLAGEWKIDFKKANNERGVFIDKLQKKLSRNSLEELVIKTFELRKEHISEKQFYDYIAAKADKVNTELVDFTEFHKYIIYVAAYDSIDKVKIMDEVDTIENKIWGALCRNEKQRTLGLLSKRLTLMKNIFDISLTRDDYKCYREYEKSFAVDNYILFINKETPIYGISAKLESGISNLDIYRESMHDFYEYSSKRDLAFLDNIRFGKPGAGIHSPDTQISIVITGGFHTENLAELFKKNNISYISIMPNFKDCEGYECRYLRLLSGKDVKAEEGYNKISKSTLAYYGALNPLSRQVDAAEYEAHMQEMRSRIALETQEGQITQGLEQTEHVEQSVTKPSSEKTSIEPSLFSAIAAFLVFSQIGYYCAYIAGYSMTLIAGYLMTLVIHEFAHWFVLRYVAHVKNTKIIFKLFYYCIPAVGIAYESDELKGVSTARRVLIHMAGPLSNAILAVPLIFLCVSMSAIGSGIGTLLAANILLVDFAMLTIGSAIDYWNTAKLLFKRFTAALYANSRGAQAGPRVYAKEPEALPGPAGRITGKSGIIKMADISRMRAAPNRDEGASGSAASDEESQTPMAVVMHEQTPVVESRQTAILNGLRATEIKDSDVKIVVGVPEDMNEAKVQPTLSIINRALAAKGFGRIDDNKQAIKFTIYANNAAKTMESQDRAIQKAREGLPPQGRIVVFSPQTEGELKIAGQTKSYYSSQTAIIVVPDAYTDASPEEGAYPDIWIRVALAKNIAFYYIGKDPQTAITIINELLVKTADGYVPIITMDDLLNILRPLKIRPVDYNRDIGEWQRAHEAVATAL